MNPIQALRRASFNTFLTDAIAQRYDPLTGIKGLYCVKPIPADTLIAAVPLFACISPATVMTSRAGRTIGERLREEGYAAKAPLATPRPFSSSTSAAAASSAAVSSFPPLFQPPAPEVSLNVSRDSMLVAAFTALSMNRGPLKEYLSTLTVEGGGALLAGDGNSRSALREKLRSLALPTAAMSYHQCENRGAAALEAGDALVAKYDALQEASLKVMQSVFEDVVVKNNGGGGGGISSSSPPSAISFTLEQLITANALCESRVLSIPTDLDGTTYQQDEEEDAEKEDDDSSSMVDLLGGPALIPWFDLINHSDAPSNMAAAVMRTDGPNSILPDRLKQIAPLCVVGASRRAIKVGEEITYEYMEPIPNARREAIRLMTIMDARGDAEGSMKDARGEDYTTHSKGDMPYVSSPSPSPSPSSVAEAYNNRLLLWATRFHFIPQHVQQ